MVHSEHHPKIAELSPTNISKLAPFSGLIISVIFVLLFLIKHYVLELFLLRRIYGRTYTNLDEKARRGFLNHHIAGATKIIILLSGAYPFICVAMGIMTLHSPYSKGSVVTLGDVLIVAAQMLIAMYVFELLYRTTVSPIGILHHVGTILVGQSAIAISLNAIREKDASIEFILCTVWGAFDIVSEFLPHVAIILYRINPDSHVFLRNVFAIACFTTLSGTICETIVVMYLFGSLWSRWTIAFKIVTPVLHCGFSACQLHGSRVFWKMYRRQQGLIKAKQEGGGGAREEEEGQREQVPRGTEEEESRRKESRVEESRVEESRGKDEAVMQV